MFADHSAHVQMQAVGGFGRAQVDDQSATVTWKMMWQKTKGIGRQ